jgi:hypothetical protein
MHTPSLNLVNTASVSSYKIFVTSIKNSKPVFYQSFPHEMMYNECICDVCEGMPQVSTLCKFFKEIPQFIQMMCIYLHDYNERH